MRWPRSKTSTAVPVARMAIWRTLAGTAHNNRGRRPRRYSRRRPAPTSILRTRRPAQAVRARLPIQSVNGLASGGLEAGVVGHAQHGDADLSAADFSGVLVGGAGGLGIVPLQSPLTSAWNQRHSEF